jgi:hypothetical protein
VGGSHTRRHLQYPGHSRESVSARPADPEDRNDIRASGPEGLCLAASRSALLAAGTDQRGLIYAVLELADRVKYGVSLDVKSPVLKKPANTIRSCARCFVSDIEDNSWFYESPRNRSRQSMPVHPGLPHQVAPRPSLLAGALVYFLTNPVGDGSEAKRHEIAALERRFVRTHVSVRQVSSRRGPSLTWRIIAPK